MMLSERIAEQVARLPPELKAFLDQQLAAGNELIDVEIGRGPEAGRVALVMNHPFRHVPDRPPEGLKYREIRNRDPLIFEYYTPDEKWSLLTAKFKPMVLQAIHGPPIPKAPEPKPERKRAKKEAVAEWTPPAKEPVPPGPAITPKPVEAKDRFIASMTMTFDMWHDGLGYDLGALAQVREADLPAIEAILLRHHPVDWRDIEALAQINTPTARAAVVAALHHSNPKVRREAMRHAAEEVNPAQREKLLLESLQADDVFGGLSQAIDEAAKFHPPAVVELLIRGTLNRPGTTACLFAGLVYYIHGKAKEPFDWGQRPFFLRFHTQDRAERKAAFAELCQTIGIDPQKYHCSL